MHRLVPDRGSGARRRCDLPCSQALPARRHAVCVSRGGFGWHPGYAIAAGKATRRPRPPRRPALGLPRPPRRFAPRQRRRHTPPHGSAPRPGVGSTRSSFVPAGLRRRCFHSPSEFFRLAGCREGTDAWARLLPAGDLGLPSAAAITRTGLRRCYRCRGRRGPAAPSTARATVAERRLKSRPRFAGVSWPRRGCFTSANPDGRARMMLCATGRCTGDGGGPWSTRGSRESGCRNDRSSPRLVDVELTAIPEGITARH